jgi:hypothetical protein
MHVVDIRVGAEIRRGVTGGNHQARQILTALGIKHTQIFRENARLVTKLSAERKRQQREWERQDATHRL